MIPPLRDCPDSEVFKVYAVHFNVKGESAMIHEEREDGTRVIMKTDAWLVGKVDILLYPTFPSDLF